MIKTFGIVDLYKHYGKKITEQEAPAEVDPENVAEPGEDEPEDSEPGDKSMSTKFKLEGSKSRIMVFFDDMQMVPSTFEIDFMFNIIFDSAKIREEYSDTAVEDEPSEPLPDGAADKLAIAAMEKQPEPERAKTVDYERFYLEVIRKTLSAYAIWHKTRDLQNAGVFAEALGDFKITDVNLATVVDEKLLLKTFIQKDKKSQGTTPVSVPFAYAVSIQAKAAYIRDKQGKPIKRMYSKGEVTQVAQSFIPAFERNILVDTKFYSFSKGTRKVKKGPVQQ